MMNKMSEGYRKREKKTHTRNQSEDCFMHTEREEPHRNKVITDFLKAHVYTREFQIDQN